MPRRRLKAKARIGITDATLDELQEGPGCVLDHDEPTYVLKAGDAPTIYSVFESPLMARATWLAFKDVVMAECEPLERPWAWWTFEVKEPRIATQRCVDPECRHRDNPQVQGDGSVRLRPLPASSRRPCRASHPRGRRPTKVRGGAQIRNVEATA